MTSGIKIAVEREVAWEIMETRPETFAKHSWESSTVFGWSEASAGLLEVVIAEETVTCSAKGPKIGADVNEDAFLPEAIEALDGGISPRFARRDEPKVDTQQQVKPNDLGEAETIPAAAGGRHLVVHLRDLRQTHKDPGINKMAAERGRLLIGELAGRNCLSDHINGVDGIEPSNASRSSQISGTDQVGLLKVAHSVSGEIGIRRPAGQTADLDFFRLSGPSQDLFDCRDGRESANTPALEFEVKGFRSDAGKSSSPCLMSRKFVAEGQDLTNKAGGRPVADMPRDTASICKPGNAFGLEATNPFS